MNRVNLVIDKTNGKLIALKMKPSDSDVEYINFRNRYEHRYHFNSLKKFIEYRRDVLNNEEWIF